MLKRKRNTNTPRIFDEKKEIGKDQLTIAEFTWTNFFQQEQISIRFWQRKSFLRNSIARVPRPKPIRGLFFIILNFVLTFIQIKHDFVFLLKMTKS